MLTFYALHFACFAANNLTDNSLNATEVQQRANITDFKLDYIFNILLFILNLFIILVTSKSLSVKTDSPLTASQTTTIKPLLSVATRLDSR